MATEIMTIFKTLDACGTLCPLPVIKAQKAIQEIPVGEILEIVATDDGSVGDIPAWVKNTGHELLTYSHDEDTHRFLVRRQK
jgi:tRNA 2-thiouridine synthesizing protein A